MKNAGRYVLVVTALMALVNPAGLADTLELKDGRLLEGNYMGGTRTTLRFQIGDEVEVIPTRDVLALTLTGSGVASSTGSNSAPSSATDFSQGLRGGSITVPAGTRLLVRLVDSIDSKNDRAGARFTTVLEAPLEVNGRQVAPTGTKVYGRLTDARRGGRVSGRAELQLELTDVVINDHRYPIITEEYELQGRSQGTAKKTLGGAALGALIGGSDGAKKGAAAGFGLSLLTKGKQLSIPSGTLIYFRLQQPLAILA